MALGSAPVIAEVVPTTHKHPKASSEVDRSASHTALKPPPRRPTRSKEEAVSKKREVSTSSRKRLASPSIAQWKRARTALTISARRRSLSISPHMRGTAKLIDETMDWPTDGQIDPALYEGGIPARRALEQSAQNSPRQVNRELLSSATRIAPWLQIYGSNFAHWGAISIERFSVAKISLSLGILILYPLPDFLEGPSGFAI